ncbi:MAG: OB-fold nucleic acid binding domain-containing protein, partial [Candidatus Bathyarchaeota archaeon]
MSTVDDIIKRILALRPNLTREAVERLIEEERAKAAGLLTEEAAAHLVASNLGLDNAGERIEAKLKIGDLTSGLNDVSLTGRVIHVFPAHTFTRRDGREGKVLRMLLGDSTGSVAVVFWDEKADQVAVSKISDGKIVRVLHGYTRERRGEIEINVGNRGQIYMEPLDAVESDFPRAESFYKTPAEVFRPGTVNLLGVVVDKFPVNTFTRQDGSEGRVCRVTLEEGGGRINLVAWDDKVDEIQEIEKGTKIRVVGGNARERQDRSLEVHTSYNTEIEVLELGVEPEEPVPHWTKLADLRTGMSSVNVAAQVAEIGEKREFTRRDGSTGRVVSVL